MSSAIQSRDPADKVPVGKDVAATGEVHNVDVSDIAQESLTAWQVASSAPTPSVEGTGPVIVTEHQRSSGLFKKPGAVEGRTEIAVQGTYVVQEKAINDRWAALNKEHGQFISEHGKLLNNLLGPNASAYRAQLEALPTKDRELLTEILYVAKQQQAIMEKNLSKPKNPFDKTFKTTDEYVARLKTRFKSIRKGLTFASIARNKIAVPANIVIHKFESNGQTVSSVRSGTITDETNETHSLKFYKGAMSIGQERESPSHQFQFLNNVKEGDPNYDLAQKLLADDKNPLTRDPMRIIDQERRVLFAEGAEPPEYSRVRFLEQYEEAWKKDVDKVIEKEKARIEGLKGKAEAENVDGLDYQIQCLEEFRLSPQSFYQERSMYLRNQYLHVITANIQARPDLLQKALDGEAKVMDLIDLRYMEEHEAKAKNGWFWNEKGGLEDMQMLFNENSKIKIVKENESPFFSRSEGTTTYQIPLPNGFDQKHVGAEVKLNSYLLNIPVRYQEGKDYSLCAEINQGAEEKLSARADELSKSDPEASNKFRTLSSHIQALRENKVAKGFIEASRIQEEILEMDVGLTAGCRQAKDRTGGMYIVSTIRRMLGQFLKVENEQAKLVEEKRKRADAFEINLPKELTLKGYNELYKERNELLKTVERCKRDIAQAKERIKTNKEDKEAHKQMATLEGYLDYAHTELASCEIKMATLLSTLNYPDTENQLRSLAQLRNESVEEREKLQAMRKENRAFLLQTAKDEFRSSGANLQLIRLNIGNPFIKASGLKEKEAVQLGQIAFACFREEPNPIVRDEMGQALAFSADTSMLWQKILSYLPGRDYSLPPARSLKEDHQVTKTK